MTNPALDQMRATLENEIKAVEQALITLRGQRDTIGAQIRAKVIEQNELRSALARLTPRQRRKSVTVEEAEPTA